MPIAADLYYHIYEGGEEGKRPTVVLLHGAGGNHLYWPSEIRRLPHYRVYALDLPGHGNSGGRGQQSIPAYAQAVLGWLEAVQLHSAVFVGHSMGSAIALHLALDHSEQVLALGLIGSGARLPVNSQLLEVTGNPTTFHTAVSAIVDYSFGSQATAQLTALAARRMGETRPAVLHGDLLACDAFDESERVSSLRQPALILTGAEDRMTPVRYAQFLASAIAKSRLEIVPGAGHMVMLEQPVAAAHLLLDFLNTLVY